LLIDEASRVEEKMYRALTPMLANGKGDMWLMSTPFRKRGFFYSIWEHGGPEWHKVRVPATECPRISREFLEEDRANQRGDFAMEYLCEFREDETAAFCKELLDFAMDPDAKPLSVAPLMSSWR
jgi:hypothetical protein